VIGQLAFVALALAPVAGDSPPETITNPEYRSCARDLSDGKLGPGNVRYRDPLFVAAIRECAERTIAFEPEDDPVLLGLRNTRLYIETLAILNSLPRHQERAGAALIELVPATGTSRPQDSVDPLTSEDFSILYWPWARCLGAVLREEGAAQADQAVSKAHSQCETVGSMADGEALRLLDQDESYGDRDRQHAVLSDFKATLSQLAVLGALRSSDEDLGTALERSDKATQ
jgi:hypothetical protein